MLITVFTLPPKLGYFSKLNVLRFVDSHCMSRNKHYFSIIFIYYTNLSFILFLRHNKTVVALLLLLALIRTKNKITEQLVLISFDPFKNIISIDLNKFSDDDSLYGVYFKLLWAFVTSEEFTRT